MRAFDSIAKKMAIPMVVLFEIGWLVFTGGLGAILHEITRELQDSTTQNADDVLNTPVLFPDYFTLVAGQFVAALFLLHAALPSSVVGTIVGVLSSFLNIIFFVSVGYLIHTNVPYVLALEEIVRSLQDSSLSSPAEYLTYLHSYRCMLGGAIIMTVSWGVVQLLVFFYECRVGPDRESSLWQNKRNLWCVIRECANSLSTSTSQEFKASPGELLRLCTIPLLVLSAVGWSVSVAGLYKISDIAASSRSGSSSRSLDFQFQYDFATCVIFFVAPLLYLTSFLHAGCSGGASTMSGVFSSILNTFLVVNMGYKLVDISRTKYTQSQAPTSSYDYYYNSDTYISDTERAIRHNHSLILGGGVVCLFFWMIICAAWHFYRVKGSRAQHVRLEESTAFPGMVGDQPQDVAHVPVQQYACNTSFVPQQLPPYTKPVGVEMQPVANIN